MLGGARDRLAGAILFVIALAWLAGVNLLIPEPAAGPMIGPRGFPFVMGIALALLSLSLIGRTLFDAKRSEGAEIDAVMRKLEARNEYWALLATFGFLFGYLLLLTWLGFVIGTVIATAALLWFVLKQRSPALLLGLPLGLSLGVWLVLGKIMGVYLPRGPLVDLF